MWVHLIFHKRYMIATYTRTTLDTVQRKILTGENIDEFPAIRQYFPYQNFPFS